MKRIFLIACVKKKQAIPAKARELYTSPLFRLSLCYAEKQHPDAIYILSAKHGLVELNQILEPYEQTIIGKNKQVLQAWGEKVKGQLEKKANLQKDQFVFLAGEKYQQALRPYILNYENPLQGLGLGKRLKFLKGQISNVK